MFLWAQLWLSTGLLTKLQVDLLLKINLHYRPTYVVMWRFTLVVTLR